MNVRPYAFAASGPDWGKGSAADQVERARGGRYRHRAASGPSRRAPPPPRKLGVEEVAEILMQIMRARPGGRRISATAFKVAVAFAYRLDRKGETCGWCYPSVRNLATLTGLSERAVKKGVAELKKSSFVFAFRPSDGRNLAYYTLCMPPGVARPRRPFIAGEPRQDGDRIDINEVYKRILSVARSDASANATKVAFVIAWHTAIGPAFYGLGADSDWTRPAVETIAAEAGLHPRTVTPMLHALAEHGIVEMERSRGRNPHRMTFSASPSGADSTLQSGSRLASIDAGEASGWQASFGALAEAQNSKEAQEVPDATVNQIAGLDSGIRTGAPAASSTLQNETRLEGSTVNQIAGLEPNSPENHPTLQNEVSEPCKTGYTESIDMNQPSFSPSPAPRASVALDRFGVDRAAVNAALGRMPTAADVDRMIKAGVGGESAPSEWWKGAGSISAKALARTGGGPSR